MRDTPSELTERCEWALDIGRRRGCLPGSPIASTHVGTRDSFDGARALFARVDQLELGKVD